MFKEYFRTVVHHDSEQQEYPRTCIRGVQTYPRNLVGAGFAERVTVRNAKVVNEVKKKLLMKEIEPATSTNNAAEVSGRPGSTGMGACC